jgi:hypothetical protein
MGPGSTAATPWKPSHFVARLGRCWTQSMCDHRTIWETARMLEDKITDLQAELEAASSRAERSQCNKRIHSLQGLLDWCTTREGYAQP